MDYKESKCNKVVMEDCRLKKTNDKKIDFKMSYTKILTDKGRRYLKLTARNVLINSNMKRISELDKYGEKMLYVKLCNY